MYRKETLVKSKENRIVLVCNHGMGIKNFKILAQSDNAIDVEFELIEKKNVPIIRDWNTDGKFKEIEQLYYIVDLDTNRLIRVSKIGFETEIPINAKKPMILFGIYTDVEPVIKKEKNKFKVKSSEDFVTANFYWIDEENMPGAIFIIDFEKMEVQKIQQINFIN